VPNRARLIAATVLQGVFDHADADQVKMMEERVIVVNEDDRVIGAATKKECEEATLAWLSTQLAVTVACFAGGLPPKISCARFHGRPPCVCRLVS
jgi:hypothetical protein